MKGLQRKRFVRLRTGRRETPPHPPSCHDEGLSSKTSCVSHERAIDASAGRKRHFPSCSRGPGGYYFGMAFGSRTQRVALFAQILAIIPLLLPGGIILSVCVQDGALGLHGATWTSCGDTCECCADAGSPTGEPSGCCSREGLAGGERSLRDAPAPEPTASCCVIVGRTDGDAGKRASRCEVASLSLPAAAPVPCRPMSAGVRFVLSCVAVQPVFVGAFVTPLLS